MQYTCKGLYPISRGNGWSFVVIEYIKEGQDVAHFLLYSNVNIRVLTVNEVKEIVGVPLGVDQAKCVVYITNTTPQSRVTVLLQPYLLMVSHRKIGQNRGLRWSPWLHHQFGLKKGYGTLLLLIFAGVNFRVFRVFQKIVKLKTR